MFGELLGVFLNVVTPVFGIVIIGYLIGPRLELEARTLSRIAYYVLVPAFVFRVVSTSEIVLSDTLRMAAFVFVCHAVFAVAGWLVARALRCSREMTAAFVMVSVFGNVGNFGLALVHFRLGAEGLAYATIYFVLINIVAFGICVAVASSARGSGSSPLVSVLKTPALVAVVPAVLFSLNDVQVPTMAARILELLSGAMIPAMLLTLGLQLAGADSLRLSWKELTATSLRLVVAPLIAATLIGWFGLTGINRSAGILQSGMPVAILVSIVSIEYGIAPTFVTTVVFLSTLCSLPTLTFLLAVV